jgi:hypothetical protein
MAVKYKRRPHAKCKRCGHSYGLAQKRYATWFIPTACQWCPGCPEYIGVVKLLGYGPKSRPGR